ncbi:MAG: hypothetical protein HFJ09_13520 [Lachnospiraceae bacterium]|nr:hypothetical protein [Lachnospiraceae bacterium]
MKLKWKKRIALGIAGVAIGLSAMTVKAQVCSVRADSTVTIAGSVNLEANDWYSLYGNVYTYRGWLSGSNCHAITKGTAYFTVGKWKNGEKQNFTNVVSRHELYGAKYYTYTKTGTIGDKYKNMGVKIHINNGSRWLDNSTYATCK